MFKFCGLCAAIWGSCGLWFKCSETSSRCLSEKGFGDSAVILELFSWAGPHVFVLLWEESSDALQLLLPRRVAYHFLTCFILGPASPDLAAEA